MAAWKGSPKYKARMLDAKSNVLAETSLYTATPNANGNTSANLTSAQRYELPFEVKESGKYVISFVNDGTAFNEFLLLECRVAADTAAGITFHTSSDTRCPAGIYSPSGIRRQSLQRGLNIVVTEDGTKRKIMIQ